MIFKRAEKKKIIEINKSWGKPKDEIPHFDLIENYFYKKGKSETSQTIDNKTINDIDFYEVFAYTDRTNSKVGQQYLFNKLLNINPNIDFSEQEQIIDYFIQNEKERIKAQVLLSKLNKQETYYISDLIFDEYIKKPKWFWIIPILSALPLIVSIFLFTFSKFLILLLLLILTNVIIHFWNKRNLITYTNSIPQLLSLCHNTYELMKLNLPVESINIVCHSLKSIEKLRSRMSIFSLEAKGSSELMTLVYLIVEYVKIIFLLEPLIVFNVLEKLDKKRTEMQILFEYVGKIDSAISIASFRAGLPYFCKPTISKKASDLQFKDIYHPLVSDCVSNSLNVNNSILLTGSNMAGKTTFIRTVAINVLLGQTINTCFAKELELSPMRLFSAIRISDDLLNDRSYYFEEVLTIKNMITESQSPSTNLFLLDEIFKGTNTIERIAAGKAVLSYIAKQNNNIVFVSTHDIELTDLLKDSYDVYHFTEIIENGQIHFDYKLKQGCLKTKNAIRILEMNNYPKEVIDEANVITKLF